MGATNQKRLRNTDLEYSRNSRLQAKYYSPMFQDAAMVLEEQPEKVSEAFRIFLQGRGYCLRIRKQSIAEY
jgi:hypothetical protein